MQSPHHSPLPRVDWAYAKTAAGHDELRHRTAGLNARQRTALIMLDGQREARALATVIPADQLAPIVAALLALGLIGAAPDEELVASIAPEPAAGHASAPAPDDARLAAIKAELISAAETYLGVMATEVVAPVRQAGDAVQLLRVLGRWHMAMQASKHGKDAGRTLLARSKLYLDGAALS